MRLKHVGMNPICAAVRQEHEDFVGEYHPSCCRWPKSCSSELYEYYPENDVEIPKKLRVMRVRGVGPGTKFDWAVFGYHPTAPGTITLWKYFPNFDSANSFARLNISWRKLLIAEGLND